MLIVNFTNDAVNAALDGLTDRIEDGAGESLLRLYSGFPPPSPSSPPSGDLLVEFSLPSDAFGPAVDGVATLTAPLTATATANGQAKMLRIVDGDDETMLDGNVGELGDGTALEMNVTDIASGFPVTITALTITLPSSVD